MDFKKYYVVHAAPELVYKALTREATIHLWTGSQVMMQEEVGSEFSLFDDSIVGKNLAFEPDKKIVQEWYFGELPEPSIVTIKLHEHKKGTSIEVVHTNIPEEDYENMRHGWDEIYMGSLQDFFDDDTE